MLRWTHFLLFILTTLAIMARKDSDVPLRADSDSMLELTVEEVERREMMDEHRDSAWKLFSRCSDTISAFLYQAVIFHA